MGAGAMKARPFLPYYPCQSNRSIKMRRGGGYLVVALVNPRLMLCKVRKTIPNLCEPPVGSEDGYLGGVSRLG